MKRSLPIEEPNRLLQLGCAAGGMRPIRPNEHVYELRERGTARTASGGTALTTKPIGAFPSLI